MFKLFLRVHLNNSVGNDLGKMFLKDNAFLFNFDVCILNQKYLCAVEIRKNGCMFFKTCNNPYQVSRFLQQ